ncbi:MAG TPA: hypothetical protein DCL35_02530 [Candidatus Omnitrophica bacterium]|nr:hypothetical protein [Candidatus Omnitrophota bacterium]
MIEKSSLYPEKLLFFSALFTLFFIPIYNSLTSIGIGLTFLFLTLTMISRRFCLKGRYQYIAAVVLFFLLSIISMANSSAPAASLKGLKKLSIYFFLYLSALACVRDEKRVKGFIFILIFSAVVVSLDGLYQFAQGQDWFSARELMSYPHLGIKRVTASFNQAGSLGIHLGLILPIALSLSIFYGPGAAKWLSRAAVVLIMPALALTYAPGAAFGIYAAALLIAALKKKIWIAALLLTGLIFGSFLLPESLTSWPNGSLFTSVIGRVNMWSTGLKIISIHPFIGSGLHTFPINYQNLCLPGQPHCGGGAPYAHNMYLQMAAETGLLGLGAFLALMVITFKGLLFIFRSEKTGNFIKTTSLGLIGGITAYLTHGLLESSIYTSQGALLFWAMLGLSHALIKNC